MITRVVKIKGDDYSYACDKMTQRSTYYGKSTDAKPSVCIMNADIFYEMDTKKVYLYDADTAEWLEQ